MSRFIFITLAFAVTGFAQSGSKTVAPKVVFVCEHGAAKSVMAGAEFARLARQHGLAVEVITRGTNPDAEVGPAIRKNLLADGMDVGPAKPIKVTAKDLQGAVAVVTFGPDLSALLPRGTRSLDWSATPPPSQDYQAARNYIMAQLEKLVADLQKSR